jgi:flotillin
MLMIEKMEAMVQAQVEAIKNIKIDKVVVWDSLGGGKSSTAQFLSGMAGALPPLHEIAKSAGIELPNFMGKMSQQIEEKAEDLLAAKADESGGKVPKA